MEVVKTLGEVACRQVVTNREVREDAEAVQKAVALGVDLVRENLAERVRRMEDGDHWDVQLYARTEEDVTMRMTEVTVMGWIDPVKASV